MRVQKHIHTNPSCAGKQMHTQEQLQAIAVCSVCLWGLVAARCNITPTSYHDSSHYLVWVSAWAAVLAEDCLIVYIAGRLRDVCLRAAAVLRLFALARCCLACRFFRLDSLQPDQCQLATRRLQPMQCQLLVRCCQLSFLLNLCRGCVWPDPKTVDSLSHKLTLVTYTVWYLTLRLAPRRRTLLRSQ